MYEIIKNENGEYKITWTTKHDCNINIAKLVGEQSLFFDDWKNDDLLRRCVKSYLAQFDDEIYYTFPDEAVKEIAEKVKNYLKKF